MANTRGRVLIPTNPEDKLKLADKVFAKHQQDGNTSELNNMDSDYDWLKVGPTIKQGQELHKKAEDLKGEMEKTYRLRDAILKPIDAHLTGTANYLKGKYSKKPKMMSDWGFEIDDTPKAPKKKP